MIFISPEMRTGDIGARRFSGQLNENNKLAIKMKSSHCCLLVNHLVEKLKGHRFEFGIGRLAEQAFKRQLKNRVL